LTGYNPLLPSATLELLFDVAGRQVETMDRGSMGIPVRKLQNRAALDLLNTQWIVSHRPLEVEGLTLQRSFGPEQRDGMPALEGVPDSARQFVYENTLRMPRAGLVRRARFVSAPDAILAAIRDLDPRKEVLVEDDRLVGEFPGHFRAVPVRRVGDGLELDVDAGPGGYLVISELAHPGWRAWIDGHEASLHRANGYFQLLQLGAGQHHVELVYRPRSLQVGAALTWISLLGTLGLVLRRPGGR
jgi:hypothetical protein